MSIKVNFENQKFFYDLIMENKIENLDEDNNTVQINGEIRKSSIQTSKKRDGTVIPRYCIINYWGFKIRFHRLVYMYHTRELIPEGLYINHIDGNKQNNHYDNLELVTQSENMKHACKIGLLTSPGLTGELVGTAKLTNEQAAQFHREFKAKEKTVKDIATEAGISITAAYDMLLGHTWKTIDKIESPSPLLGTVKGENQPAAKLTDEKVIKYRNLHKLGLISVSEIAAEAGICERNVRNMLTCNTWKHIGDGIQKPLGRATCERSGRAKLTNEQVIDYRRRFKAGELTVKQICEETGMFNTSVYNMLKGKTWSTVDNGESICIKEVHKVKMTNKQTGEEKIFNSFDECCAYIKSVHPDRTDKIIRNYVKGVIKGSRSSAFGAKFEYVD